MKAQGRDALLTREALDFIEKNLHAKDWELTDVTPTTAGMTNRSFRFTCRGTGYILRVPGEGTDKLIDRRHEAANYEALRGNTITDHLLAIDPNTGYKLTEYWPVTRNCDPNSPEDVKRCMAFLRDFHHQRFQVGHTFDLFQNISFYESLMGGKSEYEDFEAVKTRCMAMRPFLDSLKKDCVLTHVDAVPDNFLFVTHPDGEKIHLIDWEYAGMCDPHLDIAMFVVYAGYDIKMLHQLMDWYFEGSWDMETELKLYCYVALSGLLWSNWCEYKKSLGVDFGDYARMQYRYASEFSALFHEKYQAFGGGSK